MQAPRYVSLSGTIFLAAATGVLVMSFAIGTVAQNSVPPTAAQAAKMPQWSRRLIPPGNRPPSPQNRALRNSPGSGEPVYENGPINGNTDAWTINFGFVVSDTFTVGEFENIEGMSFGAWLTPFDTLESVEISITSSPNGGNSFFDQTVNLTQSNCVTNDFGFAVCTETTSFNGPTLQPGTYWVNLQNASVSTGSPAYWDENSGIGCHSSGCPSQAEEDTIGTIPSESFSMLGPCPPVEEQPAPQQAAIAVPRSPTQTYRVIYNFTGGADGGAPATSLAIDAAGNLYGMTGYGGPFGGGTAFKLSPGASGWQFSRLYSFPQPTLGRDNTIVRDPDGQLLGTTAAVGEGAIFSLTPPDHILPSVFSNWMETLLYSFSGGSDGADPSGSIVLDRSGDIYGTTRMQGANHGGTLYEFANGGLQVLHAFPAFQGDGNIPIGVVNASERLYGITKSGGQYGAGTFYTTGGGYQLLHSFTDAEIGNPNSLAADQAGNLYGSAGRSSNCPRGNGGAVFSLSPPDWDPLTLVAFGPTGGAVSSWISTDAQGNVYGATDSWGSNGLGNVFKLTCCWNYTDLYDFPGAPNDGEGPAASPAVDAQGNIYGTTLNGGAHGFGVVWEISP
jgi:uncharacterized repeat protein (TIGR03803 family)